MNGLPTIRWSLRDRSGSLRLVPSGVKIAPQSGAGVKPAIALRKPGAFMATLAGVLGIVTLAGAVFALVAGDRIVAIDCLVISGLSFAVWGVTRWRSNQPPK